MSMHLFPEWNLSVWKYILYEKLKTPKASVLGG